MIACRRKTEYLYSTSHDGRVRPLGALRKLQSLWILTNLFTTEQIAWLRAHLPEVESDALAALMSLGKPQ